MYFLIEQYRYETEILRKYFGDSLGSLGHDSLTTLAGDEIFYTLCDNRKYIKFDYVGYCYIHTENEDETDKCIFFIPKVVLNSDDDENTAPKAKVLLKYAPEDIICSETLKVIDYESYSFILKLSFEVCKAIEVYHNSIKTAQLPVAQDIDSIRANLNNRPQSLLDLLQSFEKFSLENRDYFMFLSQESHNPQKKINWRRTIQSTQPFFQKKRPFYLNPITKKSEIDFDEELLVIFYSILHYINSEYDLRCPINEGYNLITGSAFKHYLTGYGQIRMAQIQFRYFSDKSLELWSLCNEFFCHLATSENRITTEYLLAKGFHEVFEKMMDHLIGDEDKETQRQKKLRDGKEIDHLYRGQSLIKPDREIFYIADSKYYTIGAVMDDKSRWKQFTYATDIQNEIRYNQLSDKGNSTWPIILDETTFGYDIIPNYLISASLPRGDNMTSFDYESIMKNPLSPADNHIQHLENGLFSSSTKYIFRYNINFLFAITLYARDSDSEIADFKKRVRKYFLDHIIEEYDSHFIFFIVSLPQRKDERDILLLNIPSSSNSYFPMFGKLFSYININTHLREYIIGLERKSPNDCLSSTYSKLEWMYIYDLLCSNGYTPQKITLKQINNK